MHDTGQDGGRATDLLAQRVFNSYSEAYSRRHGQSGTLFQGAYRAIAVDEESYLLQLCRYVHANAVIHGLVTDVASWPH